jgi:hypothetical protein
MRKSMAWMVLVGLVAMVGLAPSLQAQAKKDKATGLDRIEGTVTDVRADKSEILVRQHETANVIWTVAYTPETKFTYQNAEAKLDEVKAGRYVICLGTFGKDAKSQMNAQRVEIRAEKK